MNELHEFSEFQDSMRIPGGDSSARDALHFEMFALELEEEYGVQFPRRHIKDRENPLEMFERPGEFKYDFFPCVFFHMSLRVISKLFSLTFMLL